MATLAEPCQSRYRAARSRTAAGRVPERVSRFNLAVSSQLFHWLVARREVAPRMQRAFALRPLPVARETLGALRELQPLTNRLYDRIACDTDWLLETFRPLAQRCAWSAMEMAAHARTAAAARSKPRLMLPNSVFLQAAERSGLALTCGNVQAGEPYQLELVHRLHAAEHECVVAGPLTTVCEALARAARMVHASRPTVAVLTKPGPSLALRTRADVRGVGEELRRKHGMRVVYVSMADLARAKLDSAGDLRLDGEAISVIYSRYDFSHPWGRCVDDVPAGDLRDEWTTIERIEASSAVVSSSLGSRLAHRRTTQLALLRTGVIERFLPPADAAAVRAVLPEQWRLGVELGGGGPTAEAEAAEARARVESDAHGYVAKNVLRPRTGSNATQARATPALLPPRDATATPPLAHRRTATRRAGPSSPTRPRCARSREIGQGRADLCSRGRSRR